MFTAKMQYALVLLKELDERKNKGNIGPVKLAEVAMRHGLKKEFLDQVARKLRTAGYIESIRGPGGGYVLNNYPEKLSDVYDHLEPSKMKLAVEGDAAKKYLEEMYEDYLNLVDELAI